MMSVEIASPFKYGVILGIYVKFQRGISFDKNFEGQHPSCLSWVVFFSSWLGANIPWTVSGEIGDFQQVFGKDELDSGKQPPFWSVSEKGFPHGKGNFKIPVSKRAGVVFFHTSTNQCLWVMAQLVIYFGRLWQVSWTCFTYMILPVMLTQVLYPLVIYVKALKPKNLHMYVCIYLWSTLIVACIYCMIDLFTIWKQ